MSIASTARTYINRILNECDSDLEELDFSFDPEAQTPETLQDCGYHIAFTTLSNVSDDAQVLEDDFEISITFMKSGYQCELDEHQDFVDKIYCIRNSLTKFTDYDPGILKVVSPSMDIAPLDTNSNVMVITVSLLMKFSVGY